MRGFSLFVGIGIPLVAVAVVVAVSSQLSYFSSSSSGGPVTSRRTAAPMAAAKDGRGPMLGGVHDAPAGRENDLHAIDLARFAVDEHNKKTNALVEFERLVKVREQVVAGTMYYFTVEVKEGGEKKLYEAKVWEKTWENFKQLQDFKPVAGAASA